jgi:hypothetical protein
MGTDERDGRTTSFQGHSPILVENLAQIELIQSNLSAEQEAQLQEAFGEE